MQSLKVVIISIIICWCGPLQAQLLWQQASSNQKLSNAKTGVSKDTINLCFFDDFSNYSGTPDSSLWEAGSGAFINNGLAVNPISKGVASLDGLDANGSPYDFGDNYPKGTGDILTSQPINLIGFTTADSVYISFFWQQGGNGEAPDPTQSDSLVLEYKRIQDSTEVWDIVWSKVADTIESDEFNFISIPLDLEEYFINDFQFRIRIRGTLSGSYDNWHIDYVYADAGRNSGDQFFFDRTIVKSDARVFRDYVSIPTNHLLDSSFVQYLDDSSTTFVRTLDPNFSTYTLNVNFYEDSSRQLLSQYDTIFLISGYLTNKEANFVKRQNIITPFNFARDSAYSFSQKFFLSANGDTTSRNCYNAKINDTIEVKGITDDYYAYDDGTAELGVGIRTPYGKVAAEFPLYTEDTLTGIDIMFLKGEQSISGLEIGIRVWSDLLKDEDPILYSKNIIGQYGEGRNGFLRVKFDSAVVCKDTIYIGWLNYSKEFLNVGYDLNNPFNNKIFTKVNASIGWEREVDFPYAGALMIRPIFGDVDVPLARNSIADEGKIQQEPAYEVLISPNPSSGSIKINNRCQSFYVFDIHGKIQLQGNAIEENGSIDLNALTNGIYFAKFISGSNVSITRLSILK